jgi:hypothetical protein
LWKHSVDFKRVGDFYHFLSFVDVVLPGHSACNIKVFEENQNPLIFGVPVSMFLSRKKSPPIRAFPLPQAIFPAYPEYC